jgi:AcrR family transcriptional regulator
MQDDQGQPRGYHHGDLRAALLDKAGGMLEAEGAEAISLRALARAVGVTATALYNHFNNKDDLLATLAAQGFRDLTASQSAILSGSPDDPDAVLALGLDYLRFAVARPELYRLMFGAGMRKRAQEPEVAAAKHASFDPLKAALAERLSGADPAACEIAAVVAWAFVHGYANLLIDGSLHDPDIGAPSGMTYHARRRFVAGMN